MRRSNESRLASCVSRLAVVALAVWLCGCPYDASFRPTGEAVALRSSIVGTWVCDASAEADWADLSIGWSEESTYLLTLRPRRPEPDAADVPWVITAKPQRVGLHEVWTLWGDQPAREEPQYMFARLNRANAHHVQWAMLGGDAGDLKGRLDVESPDALSRLLVDPKQTVPDVVIGCHR